MPRRNKPLIPLRRQPPRLTCAGKRTFATREATTKAALELQKLHDSNAPHRPYFCSDCGKWHLTSKG